MKKRILSFLLSILMLLSLCACGPTEPAGEETTGGPVLQVGYSRVDITPSSSVPMGGYGQSSKRMSEGVAFPLYVTCIAFAYGEEKVLLYTQDLLNSAWTGTVRPFINNATGIPYDRIMICATHTHHTPDQGSNEGSIQTWQALYCNAMVQAATEALADCAPATLYGGKTETQGLNFVRHYLLADGTYGGDNFGDFSVGVLEHATEGDPQMIVLKADREGDKKDIAIVNWQAHPCKTEGGSANRLLSPDFIAPMRSYFEQETGMHFAYFTGAAGNQNTSTRIQSENNFLGFWELGKALSDCAKEAVDKATKLGGTGIRAVCESHEYPMNHENEDKLSQALEVVAYWAGTTTSEANVLAKKYGFTSVHEASAVRSRVNWPAASTYELNAIYIGGMAFVTAPYEMFTNPALYVKENSPFDITMVFSCANGSMGYFPTQEAYDYRSYEGTTARFAKGCAEDSAEVMVKLLNALQ